MSRIRDIWKARFFGVGLNFGDPLPYMVTIRAELERDGREVLVELDPDKAEMIGRSLIEYAAKGRTLNTKGQPE